MRAWGAATTVLAYVVSGGTLGLFVAVMVVLGIAQRIAAVAIVRRPGKRPPRWWGI